MVAGRVCYERFIREEEIRRGAEVLDPLRAVSNPYPDPCDLR